MLIRQEDGSDINIGTGSIWTATGFVGGASTPNWRRVMDAYGNEVLVGPTANNPAGVVLTEDIRAIGGEQILLKARLGG